MESLSVSGEKKRKKEILGSLGGWLRFGIFERILGVWERILLFWWDLGGILVRNLGLWGFEGILGVFGTGLCWFWGDLGCFGGILERI